MTSLRSFSDCVAKQGFKLSTVCLWGLCYFLSLGGRSEGKGLPYLGTEQAKVNVRGLEGVCSSKGRPHPWQTPDAKGLVADNWKNSANPVTRSTQVLEPLCLQRRFSLT